MKRLNVGISIFAVEGTQLWSNGANQHIAFLVMALRRHPGIGEIFFLNGGDTNRIPEGLEYEQLNVPLVSPQDVTFNVDVVIEMGAQLPVEWLKRVRMLGAKVVTFFVGHSYANLAEGPMFDLGGGSVFNDAPLDEVWASPQHMKSCGPMLRTVTRVPVYEMPHIWSTLFLASRIDALQREGHTFGYRPARAGGQRKGWRAFIFEPNISVVKNCTVPILVCEQAYRSRPASIELMMVMNSFQMKEHPTFNRFAVSLDLNRDRKASFEPRLNFAECMAKHHGDAVVSHHWENGLNYLYYDALYGGYPLIHNSEELRDAGVGFFYPDFDACAGAEALIQAWEQDEDFWADYKKSGLAFLRTCAPDYEPNLRGYVDRILTLTKNGEGA